MWLSSDPARARLQIFLLYFPILVYFYIAWTHLDSSDASFPGFQPAKSLISSTPPLAGARYDYIIAGGGPSGLIVATTLAKNLPSSHVLVLEKGPADCPNSEIPIMWGYGNGWEGGLGGMGEVSMRTCALHARIVHIMHTIVCTRA